MDESENDKTNSFISRIQSVQIQAQNMNEQLTAREDI